MTQRLNDSPPLAEGAGPTTRRMPERGPSTRTGLGQTVRTLTAFGENPGRHNDSERATEPVPEGRAFETRAFRSAAGMLDYKLYIPGPQRSEHLPLVIMLHGCRQSPDDFAVGTRMNLLAEEQGVIIAYPAQSAAASARRCWNWFKSGHQERNRGDPALIAGIARQILRDHPVDPDRVYVAGLPAGGAAAAVLAEAYPDLFAAVGVHSGLAVGTASGVLTALAAMRRAPASIKPCGASVPPSCSMATVTRRCM